MNVSLNRVMNDIEKILDTILIHAGEQNCNHRVNDLIEEIFSEREKKAGFTTPDHEIGGESNVIEGKRDPSRNKQEDIRFTQS